MSRVETTNSLSDLVRKRLSNKSFFWAEEVNLDAYQKRVDFMGYSPLKGGSVASVGDIERGTFAFYEIKSCMADFNSGHGKNWEGDENYLVCEKDLADRLRDKMMLPFNVAILCPNEPRTKLIPVYSGYCKPMRKKSTSELIWAMVCSRKSNKVFKIEEVEE